jgi:phosphatidylserine decarboxylase
MDIQYFHRDHERLETEKVYGDKAVRWLYESGLGRTFSSVLVRRSISRLYGSLQDSSLVSKRKIAPFIKDFSIPMDEFVPTPGRSESDPYASFNEFFIRGFKPGKRPFVQDSNLFPAPCEARYFAFEKNHAGLSIPVKGEHLSPMGLLNRSEYAPYFEGGPVVVARLCPVDYHRYHYPDHGKVIDRYRIPGVFHSVNPIALKKESQVFILNEREVSILETENFGKLAYIEVGAICVGKIVQSHKGEHFKRGEEKGYFLFGGSTVILLGEPGKWSPAADLLEWSAKGIEVYLKLGSKMGQK